MLSELDASFIDNLSMRTITNFRNDVCSLGGDVANLALLCACVLTMTCSLLFQTFTREFIDGNPQIFLNFEWINVPKLKTFIEGDVF